MVHFVYVISWLSIIDGEPTYGTYRKCFEDKEKARKYLSECANDEYNDMVKTYSGGVVRINAFDEVSIRYGYNNTKLIRIEQCELFNNKN